MTNETTLEGRVLRPGSDDYEAERLPWQRKYDPRPAVIVQAAGVDDVRAAIALARDQERPLAVQTTGHGTVAPADDTVLLKTTAFSAVEIDPARRIARARAGAVWRDVIFAAAPHGLAPLSGTSADVGVTGYTLGGGAGWLSRTYGFAADSVLRAELVTADGEVVKASADERPDLFWALRGGGGNFGVVTELEFRLHPAASVYGGMAMFDISRAAEALARYGEWALDEPEESNTAMMVMAVPPVPQMPEAVRGRRVLAFRGLYLGDGAEAERVWAPLREVAGPPLMEAIRGMAFADTVALGPPPVPAIAETRFEMLREVPDDAIAAIVEAEGPLAGIELRHWGGAMARGDGPIGHRDVPFSVFVGTQVEDRAELPAAAAAADAVAERLRPHGTGDSFLNFLGDPGKTHTAYTRADYERLAAIKREYDPGNLFRHNHNIPPAG
jgi:FAD/FMN-containing dehydrogenase